MNERIKLPDQEWLGYDPLRGGDIHGYTFEQMREFAELIVRECIDQCADNGSNDEWDKGIRWVANQIKEHFGVKE